MESNLAAADTVETGRDKMEEEMDESLLDESEEELIARMAASAKPAASLTSNRPKESCHSDGSVGNLSASFMKMSWKEATKSSRRPTQKAASPTFPQKALRGRTRASSAGGGYRGSMRW